MAGVYDVTLGMVYEAINDIETKQDAAKAVLDIMEATLTALKAEVNALKTIVISSTDTKPVGVNGQTLIEHDTKKVFVHDGTDWREW